MEENVTGCFFSEHSVLVIVAAAGVNRAAISTSITLMSDCLDCALWPNNKQLIHTLAVSVSRA